MKQERIYVIALVVLAVLASIRQIPVDAAVWGALLAIVGIVGGVMLNYQDVMQRLLVYVVAVALPMFDNCLDAVWVVGPWLNMLLDNVATGLQGLAVGTVVMGLIGRMQGGAAATR